MANLKELQIEEDTKVGHSAEMLMEKAKSLIDSGDGEGVLLYKTGDVFYAIPITKEYGKFSDVDNVVHSDTFNLLLSWIYSSPLIQNLSHQLEVVNNNLIGIGTELLRSVNPNVSVSAGVSSQSGLIIPKGGQTLR